jgi:hypothetical protein
MLKYTCFILNWCVHYRLGCGYHSFWYIFIDCWFHQTYFAGVSLNDQLVNRTWNCLIQFTIKESGCAIESLYSEWNECARVNTRIKHDLQYATNLEAYLMFENLYDKEHNNIQHNKCNMLYVMVKACQII